MTHRIIAALLLVSVVAPTLCRADSIEETEAKQRGVSVETVQLEDARAHIAELEKRLADLKKKNDELTIENSAMATQIKAQSDAINKLKPTTLPSSQFEEKIKNHGIANGMSLDELNQAFPAKTYLVNKVGENDDEKFYEIWGPQMSQIAVGNRVIGTSRQVLFYKATIVNGKVTQWREVPLTN